MWYFGIGYIAMVIFTIIFYFKACNIYGDYENSNEIDYYYKAVKYFKFSFLFFIVGLIILIIGFLYRIL